MKKVFVVLLSFLIYIVIETLSVWFGWNICFAYCFENIPKLSLVKCCVFGIGLTFAFTPMLFNNKEKK